MSTSDQERLETARKSEALWLAKFSERDSNNEVAAYLDLAPSTISKFKNPDSAINPATVSRMLACLGLKIVPVDHLTVDPAEHRALVTLAELGLGALKEDAQ